MIKSVRQNKITKKWEFDFNALELRKDIENLEKDIKNLLKNIAMGNTAKEEAKQLLITQRDPSALAVERLQDTQQRLDVNLKEAEILNAEAEELKLHYEKEFIKAQPKTRVYRG